MALIVVQNYVKSAQDSSFPEYFFELSKAEYEKYKDLIPAGENAYWLKENAQNSNEILCVQPDGALKGEDVSNGEIQLRQACWIDLKRSTEISTESKKK